MNAGLLLQELGDTLQWRNSGPTINDRSGQYVRTAVEDYLGDRWSRVKWVQSDGDYQLVIKPHLKAWLNADRTADLAPVPENRDCDDFTLRLVANAQRAGFDLAQVVDPSSKHAYALAVFPGPATPKVVEPQTRELFDLGDPLFGTHDERTYSLERGTVYY